MIGLMAGTSAFAQKKPKPSLTKVEAYVNKGKEAPLSNEDLTTAKEIIDLAADYEKTKEKSRTWYLRGTVYKFIYDSPEEIAGIAKPEALKTSSESYNKALEVGKETETYVLFSNQELEQLWSQVLNEGVESYKAGNIDDAVKYFQYTSLVKPQDTTGYLYAASAASEGQKYDLAINNYKKLVKLNPNEDTYATIISIQKDYMKDVDAAAATVAEAKEVLGEDNNLINKIEIDILIATSKVDVALAKIDKAIASEPENAKLYLRRGLLYDQLASREMQNDPVDKEKLDELIDKAAEAYKKTIEFDDKSLTAYFNYSVIISNKANVYFKEVNLMSPSQYRKSGKVLEDKGVSYLKDAVPLMEKARELSPEDRDVLFALQSFYSRLKYEEKTKEVSDKLEELGYND